MSFSVFPFLFVYPVTMFIIVILMSFILQLNDSL